MNILGEATVFKNDKGFYSTTISNKKEDGSYENMRVSIGFKKGTEIENKTKINIKNGFLSFWKNKDGLPQIKIVVLEFETLNSNSEEEYTDDLPF